MDLKGKFFGKKTLVIGGLGFIGSNLAYKLVELGARVTIVDACLEGTGFNEHNIEEIKDKVELFKKDIGEKGFAEEVVKDKDFIFNLAGQTGHSLSMQNPELDLDANCKSILNLLESCRKFNPGVKIINASTRQIYGNQILLPIREDAEKKFPDINAVHNIARENYFQLYNRVYGFAACSLRLTNTFGAGQSLNKYQGFIARFVRELITKGEIDLPVDFKTKRDINYVDDVVEAFLMAVGSSEIYNLGSNDVLSIEDFAKLMIEINGDGKLRYREGEQSGISVKDSYLDFSKIKNELGWNPETNLREAIKKTLDFYKLNRENYMKGVNFVGLKKEYEDIKEEIDEAINLVIKNAKFILGQEVEKFEKNFAEFCGCGFCSGVGNGTQAIELALKALGIGEGDEVITVDNTSPFTILGILNTNARVRFVDCKEDYLINPDKIESAITEKIKAIIPVHLYGKACDMDRILEIARKYNLYVVEDCAQANGALYKGKKVGSFGDLACFSFYETKNIGAYGDSGAVVTNNRELDEKIKILRNGGQKIKDYISYIGINSRMDEIQASILNAKLKYLSRWNFKRREIARRYNELLMGINEVICPEFDETSAYHLYVIRAKKRDELREYLKEKGIVSLVHYPIPNHLQEAFRFLWYKEGDFPITERLCKEILSLPVFPQMADEEIKEVCENIKNFYENK